jgi:hypothetical protein
VHMAMWGIWPTAVLLPQRVCSAISQESLAISPLDVVSSLFHALSMVATQFTTYTAVQLAMCCICTACPTGSSTPRSPSFSTAGTSPPSYNHTYQCFKHFIACTITLAGSALAFVICNWHKGFSPQAETLSTAADSTAAKAGSAIT